MKTTFLILYLLFFIPSFQCSSQNIRFKPISENAQLSQSEVFSIFKDSRGFMWFGTVDGLNRYDGYNITVFNTNRKDTNSLSNSTIKSLAEDQLGRVWIGTDDGLCFYDPLSERISQVKILDSTRFGSLRVFSLLHDKHYLWVGTSEGLFRANTIKNDVNDLKSGFKQIKNFCKKNLNNLESFDLEKSRDGGIWVSTDRTLSKIIIDPETGNTIVINELDLEYTPFIKNITEDINGNIWIVTVSEGLIRYNPETGISNWFKNDQSKSSLSSNWTSASVSDKNGNLWVSTIDKGLNKIDFTEIQKDKIHFQHFQNNLQETESIQSNLIYSLYVSDDNLLWIGFIGPGVSVYDPKQKPFIHYKIPPLNLNDSPPSNFIRSVYTDNQNRVWIGTHNNGLFIFDRNAKKYKKAGFDTQSVFKISQLNDGKVLVCGNSGVSLVSFNGDELKILNTYYNDVSLDIKQSSDSIFWVATLNGVFRLVVKSDRLVNSKTYDTKTSPSISSNNCRVLLFDKTKNELYIGTEGGGLNLLHLDENQFPQSSGVFKHTNDTNSISNNYVRSLLKDNSGNIWVGTYEGLNRLTKSADKNEMSFKTYSKNDGLPNNMIQLLQEDSDSNLWIGSNGGLTRFNYATGNFTNFSISDGLQSNEFSEHTSYKSPEGEIFVGGINGVNAFFPKQIEESSLVPNTTITEFYLFNKKIEVNEKVNRKVLLKTSISLTDSIVLLPDQNNFRFDFSAMLFSNPEKIKYAYKLEGYDKDWIVSSSKQRSAVYTNLKHGKYLFKVKATNNDGIWQETPKTLYIHIKTPFAYTWFAYLIYLAGIVFTIIYFTKYSVIRIATKKQIILENEHNRRLHDLDLMRTRFFINISHDLRTPLTLINGPLENVLKTQTLKPELKGQLELVNRNVKRLKYLVEQLLDVRKAEAGKLKVKPQTTNIVDFAKAEAAHFSYAFQSKGLNLNVLGSNDEIMAYFDPAMLSKVFFNLLSNALKFTDKGEINIRICKTTRDKAAVLKNAEQHEFIKVEIQDTGQGINDENLPKIFERFYNNESKLEKGYGIGLSHCKDIIEAHAGQIEVSSKPGIGTTFTFYIPNEVLPDHKEIEAAQENYFEDFQSSPENLIYDENLSVEHENSKSILIIEDNADMRMYLKNELSQAYIIIEAQDGTEGLEKAETQLPDLILSDIMMPKMDGIELCKKIKTNIKTSHIPVILLTARVDLETKYKGIEIGADDYIAKPFEMEYLFLRIKNILKTREQLRNLFQKNNTLEPSAITVTSLDEKFIVALMEALEKGIPDSNFTVNSLETEMGMSHTNFYRKIKSLTGMSGKEILQNMRMKRAYQLLNDNKDLRVSDVAFMVGYSNPKYFSKCFKEMYGIIPNEFGKQT